MLPHAGAFPEIIEATEGGLLYQPEEPSALPDALENLLSRPEEAHAMGLRGHEAVTERFSNKTLAVELVDLVKSLHPTIS